jgi:hypothetical protein
MTMPRQNTKLVATLRKQSTRQLITLIRSLRRYQSQHPKMHTAQSDRLYFAAQLLIARAKKGATLAKEFIDS